jgi:hypothetical protein
MRLVQRCPNMQPYGPPRSNYEPQIQTAKTRAEKVESDVFTPADNSHGLPRASGETAQKIIGKLAKEGNFSNIDELNAHLQRLMASGELNRLIAAAPEVPAEQAQELAYRAMEEPSSAKARKLAEKALKLDPACIDALVIRAQTRRLAPGEVISEIRAAVEAGERSLGEKEFLEARGHFGESWRRGPTCVLASGWRSHCWTPGKCGKPQPSSRP